MEKGKQIYVGLDIGTNSVGYAVADENYNLQRFHAADAWGSVVFDEGVLCDKRRTFRSARRRLDRRQQRVQLIRELFAEEIGKVDPRFFIRLTESYKWRDETDDKYIFFNDVNYTDSDYMKEYPTIHHLICELMNNKEPHDVRLVYLALAWLVAHRGHFLSEIKTEKIDEIIGFDNVYDSFKRFFSDNGYDFPWESANAKLFSDILKKKMNVNKKYTELKNCLAGIKKPEKEVTDNFPFSEEGIINLLAGKKYKLKDLFGNDDYADLESINLGMPEEKYDEVMTAIGDDFDLIRELRKLYDWSVLADIIDYEKGITCISEAKVQVYEQHKKDLKTLKYFVRNYAPDRYDEIFREANDNNYVAYSYHLTDKNKDKVKEKTNIEEFSKYIFKVVNDIVPSESDKAEFDDMRERLELRTFLPKQKITDNRVIPHQLYEYELLKIIENATAYLPFLSEIDKEGYSVKDKIHSVFTFRIPYYVGPLNMKSEYAWIEKRDGKITPWNFKDMVDENACEEAFIKRMTNTCTYIPGASVLPKDSLCYQKFMVLNEINNLKIDEKKIPVEAKQGIYKELFEKKKRVKRKDIEEYLICNNFLDKDKTESLSGIDKDIRSSLSTFISFRRMLENGILSEKQVERIVERASYAEDKTRVVKWLKKEYTFLSDDDIKYISKIKISDFGRLSRAFLTETEGADSTGEMTTVLRAMWDTNNNLMEILADKYTFAEKIGQIKAEYYHSSHKTLKERLDDMYVSNSVRRSIYRTMAIVKDIEKAFGKPDKIFVEMTRSEKKELKGKRTSSRYEQIQELYKHCGEDVKDLNDKLINMGDTVNNRLQKDSLFLYFMQFGRCAYSGEIIDLDELINDNSEKYNIEHIYPQAYVKDDSIINNKVLVLSKINGTKQDTYPINADIRNKMCGYWAHWHKIGAISDEKYKRLIRSTPFSDEERYGFINRQITETSQSTRVVATLLKEKYPDTDIIYTKAGLVSDFRREYELPKSRLYNDLHHAVDAYLNIVVGNVYDMTFSRKWFSVDQNYSVKTKTIFGRFLERDGKIIWDNSMLPNVKITARKNSAHFVKMSSRKTGGLFDQMPVKKSEGLTPLKKGLPTEKYGGYNKAGIMFLIPVKYKTGKKSDIIILPVELLFGNKFLNDALFAKEYTFERIKKITGKDAAEISFPMGMRPWKINTELSFDGFRACITGTGNGGKQLLLQDVEQFSSDYCWNNYIKKLENYVNKIKNSDHKYDEKFDLVTAEENKRLYALYINKYENSIYEKRMNSPIIILKESKEKFESLDIDSQCKVLLNIHETFGRLSTAGCDLELLGGNKKSAITLISTFVNNWRKYYSCVKVIDKSPSGLWERESCNILELL